MEWGEEQIQDLITTIGVIIAYLNAHQEALDVALACIEQLDARSQVTQSAYAGVLARLEKLENCTYGDGK